jgi:hypothetical protein
VTAFVLSMVLALTGCLGLILAGRGMWQGWAVSLAVQPVWAAFGIVTRGYGLLLSCLMYGTVYARNLRRWHRDDGARPPRMVDPPGWDKAAQRAHDVELQPGGDLLHFSTCWCRTPMPARPTRPAFMAGAPAPPTRPSPTRGVH